MNIVFVYGHMFNVQTWTRACAMLREDGIELVLFSQQQSAEKAMAFVENESVDIFIGQFFHDLPWHAELLECSEKARMRLGLGWDMPPGFSTFSEEHVLLFNNYLNKISVENYVSGIKYLAACTGVALDYDALQPVKTHGIYHPDAPALFDQTAEYNAWYAGRTEGAGRWPVIGIPCYYGQIVEKNRADLDAVIKAVESHDMVPFCVFSEGTGDGSLPLRERYPWLAYFKESGPRRLLEAESRGLWKADPDMLEEVRSMALLVEGDMEESIGEVGEEFQGNKVEVMTAADVEKWKPQWRLPLS